MSAVGHRFKGIEVVLLDGLSVELGDDVEVLHGVSFEAFVSVVNEMLSTE